jgi:regulator of replication initiation timing
MSKWLKLMKQMETARDEEAVFSTPSQQEIAPSESNDIYQAVLIALMLFAAFLTIQTAASVQKSQKQSNVLAMQYDAQQRKIQDLEHKLGDLQLHDMAALKSKVQSGNDQTERLSLENAALKVRISELEYSEQQMIDEMMAITNDQPQENPLTEGRKI